MNFTENFLDTRLEAKDAYKAWQAKPYDSKLLQVYADAWKRHQDANLLSFMSECGVDVR